MIIGIVGYKGGTGKTTTAVHLAAYLNMKEPTLLIDGDLNRSAMKWAIRGQMGIKCVSEKQAAKYAREFAHNVIDTPARPDMEDLAELADGCDLLVVTASPDPLSIDALMPAVDDLKKIGSDNFRVLLTICPPVGFAADEARQGIVASGLPILKTQIRRYVAFQKAALDGVTVDKVIHPHALDGAKDYRDVVKELMKK